MECHRLEMKRTAGGENPLHTSLFGRGDDAKYMGTTGIGIHTGNGVRPDEQRSACLKTSSQWGRHCTSSLPLPRWLLWQERRKNLAQQSLGLDSVKLEFRHRALMGPPLLLQYASGTSQPNEVTSVCHDFEKMLICNAAKTVYAAPVRRLVHVIER